jgi:hypothetical protein
MWLEDREEEREEASGIRSSGVQEFRSSGVQEFRSSFVILNAAPQVKLIPDQLRHSQILQLLNSCNSCNSYSPNFRIFR